MNTNRALAIGCLALATALGLNSVLGPLLLGIIDYRYTETFENQGIGLDAFALAFAVPLLLLAGILARVGHRAAGFLAIGPALMSAYMMPQYVLGAHYLELPGNNEDFFAFHLGLFVLSMAVSALAWHSAAVAQLPPSTSQFRRWTAILMLAVAAFLLLRYLPTLIDIALEHFTEEYQEDPIAFWAIAFMDLGIVMPIALFTGFCLLRGSQSAVKLMYAVVAWFALVGPAVAAMGFAMLLNDDPHASLSATIVFAVYGAIFAALAIYLFRSFFKPIPGPPRQIAETYPSRTGT
jgi:hypothetical protein